MQRVPLQNIPAQQFSIVLDGQNCVITLRQLGGALFMDLEADGVKVFSGHICQNCEPLPVWSTTLFRGRLLFNDTFGQEHPRYDELGERFELLFLTEDEWQALMS